MPRRRTFQVGPVTVGVPSEEPTRERLSSARIADVALRQMAQSGYDAVSMRSVARELGTGPASLYAHVANKDELDQLVIDRIASTVTVPPADPERWQDQLRQVARDLLDAYRRHPGSARAALATIPAQEGGLRAAEGMMAILLAGGVPAQAAAWFVDLAALYVSAIAAEESIWIERGRNRSGDAVQEDEVVARIRQLYASLPPATYPILSRHADVMTAGDGQERFEFGLEVLLAGLVAVSARMAG